VRPGARAVRLAKALEDQRQHAGRDALAGVADHDLDVRVDALQVTIPAQASNRSLLPRGALAIRLELVFISRLG
jgi:hypothetical protein